MSFSFLYSVYSLPNIFLPLISGLLIDIYGDQIMIFIFSIFILIGWGFFCIGFKQEYIYLMILGRFF
jgi:MFS family permease